MKWNCEGLGVLGNRLFLRLGYGITVKQVFDQIVDHNRTTKPKLGVKLSWKSAWCGVHYSPFNKRVCINFVPFVTVYYVWKGGLLP